MEKSILKSTKKVLNINVDDNNFDLDVLMHINNVFADLQQLGIGPIDGFAIEDETPTWENYLGASLLYNQIQSYMYLRVRLLFDPPTTSFAIESMNAQIEKMEWRLNVTREGESWVSPFQQTTTTVV